MGLFPTWLDSDSHYDVSGERVKAVLGGVTTLSPTRGYSLEGSTPIKQVYAGSMLVATVKGTGAGAVAYTVATDHLTGSNVVSSGSGAVEEVMDYYPYGSVRLDEKAGSFDEKRKYAGHEYDSETGLSYMVARYYDGGIGRFYGQDPVFWNLGLQELVDPQSLNSYAYVLNNPLRYIDPFGLSPADCSGLGRCLLSFFNQVGEVFRDVTSAQTANAPGPTYNQPAGDSGYDERTAMCVAQCRAVPNRVTSASAQQSMSTAEASFNNAAFLAPGWQVGKAVVNGTETIVKVFVGDIGGQASQQAVRTIRSVSWEHIWKNHAPGVTKSGKTVFMTDSQAVVGSYVKETVQHGKPLAQGGRTTFQKTFDHPIGRTQDGTVTNTLRVVRDNKTGNIITAYPLAPQ